MRMITICPQTEYGRDMIYTKQHIANQWFHDLLTQLYYSEQKFFELNDPFTIKLEQVKKYGDFYGILFNSLEINDIVWNRKTDVSESNLDIYIKAYQELEQSIKSIESKLHETLELETLE